jgi:hypothetical protein
LACLSKEVLDEPIAEHTDRPHTGRRPGAAGRRHYSAARRHRRSVKDFIRKGIVERAARGAAPRTPEEAEAMQDAEVEGRSHGRR